MFPAGLIASVASYVLVPWGIIEQGSSVWQFLEVVVIPIAFLLACAQYYLVGLLIDRFVGSIWPHGEITRATAKGD